MGFPYKRTGALPTDAKEGGGVLDKFDNYNAQKDDQIFNQPSIVPSGHVASGGIISDYTVGSDKYRALIYTSSSTFVVTDISTSPTYPAASDYFLVGGGGGGGSGHPLSLIHI